MKQKFKFFILIGIAIFFIACNNDKIDSNLISSGSIMSDSAKEQEESLDKASYEELSDLFLDTKNINFNKEVLIIFGKNNCQYCDFLKDRIKNDNDLKQLINNNFNSYYVNTSYTKTHKIDFINKISNVKTETLASVFNVLATPTIIFLRKDGNVKYIYPGYTPEFKDLVLSVISKNDSMGNYLDIDKKLKSL